MTDFHKPPNPATGRCWIGNCSKGYSTCTLQIKNFLPVQPQIKITVAGVFSSQFFTAELGISQDSNTKKCLPDDAMNKPVSGAAFIESISAEAAESAAVNHPYLQAMREGSFPDPELAFKDFAFQYGLYSCRFVRYVSAVSDNLSDPGHKQILLSNLAEEQGNSHDADLPADVLATIVGQPHAGLYRRFQDALGIDAEYRRTAQECQAGSVWSQQFLRLCEMNERVGVGAIGIGTEFIVSSIYQQILQGLKAHSELTLTQRVFFELHSQCDQEHGAQMLLIAEDLADSRAACEQIEYGTRMAIRLRVAFWDEMLERARNSSTVISFAT